MAAGEDPTAQGVVRWLTRLGARVFTLDTSRVPENTPLSLEGDRVTVGGFVLDEVRAVYVKSVALSVPLFEVNSIAQRRPQSWPARWVAERERHGLLTSALRVLEEGGAHLVNPVSSFELHALKPLQTARLLRAGVRVPATLSTNDPAAVGDFAARHGSVVYKPLGGGALVRLLSPDDLTPKRLATLGTAPVTFQQRIEGDELRVTVLDGAVVSAFRLPARDVVDARTMTDRARRVRPGPEVLAVCQRAAQALGLRFTSIDVRLSSDGVPFVLECNPTPSVADYEVPERSHALERLAAHLLAHA